MALNCLFAALYAALSILLSGAAVFAGQVLVKQPSVSFCKFPARAGQPPAAGGTFASCYRRKPFAVNKNSPCRISPAGAALCVLRGGKPACIRPSDTPAERHGPSLNTGGRRL